MKIQLKRLNDKVHFEAVNQDGVKLNIDGSPDIGGENLGFRPMETVLAGLAGCSSMDIVHILQKQKQIIKDLTIDVEAERKDEIPSVFDTIHMHVKLEGEIPVNKAKRAINLSIDKYCSVVKMLSSTVKITYDIYLNKEIIE